VRQWEGTPENREPGKCGELRWFPLGALPGHRIAYCRAALDHVTIGPTVFDLRMVDLRHASGLGEADEGRPPGPLKLTGFVVWVPVCLAGVVCLAAGQGQGSA
jgi:hypothetical protein